MLGMLLIYIYISNLEKSFYSLYTTLTAGKKKSVQL